MDEVTKTSIPIATRIARLHDRFDEATKSFRATSPLLSSIQVLNLNSYV